MFTAIELPPLAEQQEIVRRVENRFAYAVRLKARHQGAQARVTKLTPGVMAKAICSELVPQAPADEPAEALLESIRGSREQS